MPELQDLLDSGVLTNIVLSDTYLPSEDKGMMTKKLSDTRDALLQEQIDNLQLGNIDGGTF